VQASYDETQTSDVIHSYYQMHSKTSLIKKVDLNTSSNSEISSLTSSIFQSVQKLKKKQKNKAFKAVIIVIIIIIVFSESSVLKLAASKSFVSESSVSKSSVSKMILYLMNYQLLYEISSVHDEVLQCINDDLINDLDLELLNFRQKTYVKSRVNNKDLTCFKIFVIIFVI
jgi:hypothetical protein